MGTFFSTDNNKNDVEIAENNFSVERNDLEEKIKEATRKLASALASFGSSSLKSKTALKNLAECRKNLASEMSKKTELESANVRCVKNLDKEVELHTKTKRVAESKNTKCMIAIENLKKELSQCNLFRKEEENEEINKNTNNVFQVPTSEDNTRNDTERTQEEEENSINTSNVVREVEVLPNTFTVYLEERVNPSPVSNNKPLLKRGM